METKWWGPQALSSNEPFQKRIGMLDLEVQHTAQEWIISWRHHGVPVSSRQLNQQLLRIIKPGTGAQLNFNAVLPDRDVVARFDPALKIIGGGEVALFISMPAWVKVDTGVDTVADTLCAIPTLRMSDTWFGPMSAAGELSYALPYPPMTEMDGDRGPHVAWTVIYIRNRASQVLTLDRLKIPAPRLTLFADVAGRLWTSCLFAERRDGDSDASVRIDHQPPESVGPCQMLAQPIQTGTDNFVTMRVFNTLFRDSL